MAAITEPSGRIRPEILADPYELYEQLRESDPVCFDASLGGWMLTRYALARRRRGLPSAAGRSMPESG